MKTRKTVTMLVTLTVPREMTPAEARREVRTLISEQCFYAADDGDLKVKGVQAAKRPSTHRRAVQLAFF